MPIQEQVLEPVFFKTISLYSGNSARRKRSERIEHKVGILYFQKFYQHDLQKM